MYLLPLVVIILLTPKTSTTTIKDQFLRFNNLTFNNNQQIFTTARPTSTPSAASCLSKCMTHTIQCLGIIFINLSKQCTIILLSYSSSTTSTTQQNYSITDPIKDRIYLKIDFLSNHVSQFQSSCLPPQTPPSLPQFMFQQRLDDCLSFEKLWAEYENGFGHPTGNYWAGLAALHELTKLSPRKVRLEMKKYTGTWYWAEYATFQVGAAGDKYRLTIGGFDGSSTAGDSWITANANKNQNNMQFSCMGSDNDFKTNGNGQCSIGEGNSGLWFNKCNYMNPNGQMRTLRAQEWENVYYFSLDDNYPLHGFRMILV